MIFIANQSTTLIFYKINSIKIIIFNALPIYILFSVINLIYIHLLAFPRALCCPFQIRISYMIEKVSIFTMNRKIPVWHPLLNENIEKSFLVALLDCLYKSDHYSKYQVRKFYILTLMLYITIWLWLLDGATIVFPQSFIFSFRCRILKNPFLLHGENMRRTSISNYEFVHCVVFELQRSVTTWYLDFICID